MLNSTKELMYRDAKKKLVLAHKEYKEIIVGISDELHSKGLLNKNQCECIYRSLVNSYYNISETIEHQRHMEQQKVELEGVQLSIPFYDD